MKEAHIKGQGLLRPEYVFRPSQYIRRFARINKHPETATSQMPWGSEISYYPADTIGEQIWRVGIFELSICEVLWRLLDEGMNTLDIGANIGQMTSLMAAKVRSSGTVTCFEPHPQVYAELSANVERWNGAQGRDSITPMNLALSNRTGEMELYLPEDFEGNHGLASLEQGVVAANGTTHLTVSTSLLDDLLNTLLPIHLIKIDVEGHELSVFEGASKFFDTHPISDIIFEDHKEYPSATAKFLKEKGYSIYGIDASFSGLKMFEAEKRPLNCHVRDYLATRNPSRSIERLSGKGWRVL